MSHITTIAEVLRRAKDREKHAVTLHIHKNDLSGYYEAGWSLCAPSECPDYLIIEWRQGRPAVVPFKVVAEVFAQWDRLRMRRLQLEAAE